MLCYYIPRDDLLLLNSVLITGLVLDQLLVCSKQLLFIKTADDV